MPTVEYLLDYKNYIKRAKEIAKQTADPADMERNLVYASKARCYSLCPCFFEGDKGFAVVSILGKRAYLIAIATRLQDERQGIGTLLLERIFLFLTYHGIETINLKVHKDNKKAVEWYQRKGFKITGTTESELRMVKRL